MNIRICPKCRSLEVQRSRRKTLGERMLLVLLRRPYRCNTCGHRFNDSIFSQRIRMSERPGPDDARFEPRDEHELEAQEPVAQQQHRG